MKPPFRKLFRLPWRSARQIDADVDEELRFHIETRVAELVARGLGAREARTQAEREFGDIADTRAYLRSIDRHTETTTRRRDAVTEFLQDLRYGVRKLIAAPTFTLTVVVTLALGIGATTAIFSVVDAVLLKPLGFPQEDRLVRLRFTQQGRGDAGTPMDVVDYGTRANLFEGFSVIEPFPANYLTAAGEPERAQGALVNANFFTLVRGAPLRGRFFIADDDVPGAPDVVVISEGLWRRAFNADSGIIGSTIRVNAVPTTVVGIARTGAHYPLTVDVWQPIRFTAQTLSDATRGARWLAVLGRVKDEVEFDAAATQVAQISEAMEKQFPEVYRERRVAAVQVQEFAFADLTRPLWVMLAATGLVLLIACANVANLMLVRGTSREGELAVRTALGAGRGRLVRQLIAESLALTTIGALGGLALARIGMASVLHLAPPSVLLRASETLDLRALSLSAVIALLTAVIFGALPAAQIRRTDLSHALRAGARGSRALPRANHVRRLIIGIEVALAVTLLAGAGVLMRSFQRLASVDPGFRPQNMLVMRVQLPEQDYGTDARELAFAERLREQLGAIPGVQSVAMADFMPLDGGSFGFNLAIRGRPPVRPSDEPGAELRRVNAEFFEVMGVPVVRGRAFTSNDRAGSPEVMVVSAEFARRNFPNEDAIGQYVQIGWGPREEEPWRQIVGVVGDVKGNEIGAPSEPTMYLPMAQSPPTRLLAAVRSALPAATLTASARKVVRDIDPALPVFGVQTMDQMVAGSIGRQKFLAVLVGVFAAVALALAAVGLYGVIAYGVSQRTHELGVRVALGASSHRVSRMIVREGMLVTAAGLAVGLLAAVLSGRVLERLLYEVKPTDAVTLAVVAAALLVVAAIASWIPARRAARVDPIIAMRGD